MAVGAVFAQNREQHVPGVDIEIGKCVRFCDGALVEFRFINKSSNNYDFTFPLDTAPKDERGVAIDNAGIRHNTRILNLLYDYPVAFSIPANSEVRGDVFISNVPSSTKSISLLDISFQCPELGMRDGVSYHDCSYHFKDIAIETPDNTDSEQVVCQLPDFFVSPLSCLRVGNNVEMTFMLTNKGRLDNNSGQMGYNHFDKHFNIVAGGLNYNAKLRYAGDYDSISFDFPKDVPVKMSIVISDVPQSVSSFRLIRFSSKYMSRPFNIEFRNMPVGWVRAYGTND